ncbi:Crp/Fnr family transcriptional regulator [Actinoplanes couchii]|uniref:Crp/Fnr family transcriptional regulator n=1 Tax=Actinoplanes couchii TaxID=403638 RepID=A0ABQ3WZU7_9ACTN|nr:Crp/Fnr family transcriptional regulator [Actinoplanes couchii]MDR6316185.1 CRP-like cAMP-binding protein [Actinoplanes couchii]GID51800.1 Crp/Fnr family transcriptional regulator [Actinoplanes couchii]
MVSEGDPAWAPGSFLTLLSDAEREELLGLGTTRKVPGGRHLLIEGRKDTQVEVIRQGHVKVTSTVGGTPRLLAIRLPGDLVGEFAALTGSGRIATVTTCGDVVATVIRQAGFLRFVNEHPLVAAQLTVSVGRRLHWANRRRTEFTAFPVQVRLGRVLLDIATSCGEAVADGVLIRVELSQTELASLIGAREDTVQRALRDLRRAGLVRTGYRRIVVLDEAGLRALTESAEWI